MSESVLAMCLWRESQMFGFWLQVMFKAGKNVFSEKELEPYRVDGGKNIAITTFTELDFNPGLSSVLISHYRTSEIL